MTGLTVGGMVGDRYRIVGEVGGGGMGFVFEVEHVALARRFALKVLRVGQVDDELVKRFEREARALARVHSPRVAQVSDFGIAEGVGPYYVMELVPGESLQERLNRAGPIPMAEAIALAIDLCEAVEDVHREGLVHRDLKPGNIGLTTGPIPLKLLDFGLAAGVDDAFLTRITQSHQVLGSLPYIAPEQFSGSRPTVAQDMWALGVVIYEMLTAQLPFEAPSTAALMHRILTAPPPTLETFPAALREVIQRLLMKNPLARTGSAREAAEALRQLDVAALPRTIESPSVPPGAVMSASFTGASPTSDPIERPSDWPNRTSEGGHALTGPNGEVSMAELAPTLESPSVPPMVETKPGGWESQQPEPQNYVQAASSGPYAPLDAPAPQPPADPRARPTRARPSMWLWFALGIVLCGISAVTITLGISFFSEHPGEEAPLAEQPAPPVDSQSTGSESTVPDSAAPSPSPSTTVGTPGPEAPGPRGEPAVTESSQMTTRMQAESSAQAESGQAESGQAESPGQAESEQGEVGSVDPTTPELTDSDPQPDRTPMQAAWMGDFIPSMAVPSQRMDSTSDSQMGMSNGMWQGGFIP